jgi:uncharacterized delta-60 repeat protein
LEVRRLLVASGTLDPSFSIDGKTTVAPAPGETLIATDVAVQADGKTVVVGRSETPGLIRFAIARFNLDGSLDPTFGSGGLVRSNHGDLNNSFATAVAIAPDQKIVVVGTAEISEGFDEEELCVARYLPNGTLDNSFDDNGALVRDFNSVSGWTNGEDVSVQSDGKIVVVGRSIFDFFVQRFNVNGSNDGPNLEPGFGESDGAVAVKQDINNRIFVVGNVDKDAGTSSFTRHVGMQRVTLDGDTSGDFHQHFFLPAQAVTSVQDIVLQSDGKFVIAGHAAITAGGSNDFFIARFNADATPDSTFGGNLTGFRITDFGGDDVAAGMVISPSGGGFIVSGRSSGTMAAVKYTDGGLLDSTFGTGGRAFVSGFSGIANIARGPGRRVVLAGGSGFATARLLTAGANLVTVGAFDGVAREGTTDQALFVVSRPEILPIETKVYFSITGTAIGRALSLPGTRDYTLDTLIQPFAIFGSSTDTRPYVAIAPGAQFAFVRLTTINDSRFEGTETAIFTITPDVNYDIGTPAGVTISIRDDDVLTFSVGTTTATAPPKHVEVGQELQSAVTWTVPSGGWRQLSSIELRLRDLDDDDALVLLTFDEATNSFALDATAAASYGPVSLLLDKCTFAAAGATAPTVTVTFTFRFAAAAAAGRRFTLEVAASNDQGTFSGFSQVGKLYVRKKIPSDMRFLRPGEEDRKWELI